jgi:hypothetical protein
MSDAAALDTHATLRKAARILQVQLTAAEVGRIATVLDAAPTGDAGRHVRRQALRLLAFHAQHGAAAIRPVPPSGQDLVVHTGSDVRTRTAAIDDFPKNAVALLSVLSRAHARRAEEDAERAHILLDRGCWLLLFRPV